MKMDHEILDSIFFHQARKVHLHMNYYIIMKKKIIPDKIAKLNAEERRMEKNENDCYTINCIENLPSTQEKHMKCATALSSACITNIWNREINGNEKLNIYPGKYWVILNISIPSPHLKRNFFHPIFPVNPHEHESYTTSRYIN